MFYLNKYYDYIKIKRGLAYTEPHKNWVCNVLLKCNLENGKYYKYLLLK